MKADVKKSKSQSGNDFKDKLSEKLAALSKQGAINGFQESFNVNHNGFSYKQQYLANYIIENHDGKLIVVKSSTSYRSDRIKSAFWDMQGIAENSEFSKDIEASIFVVEEADKTFRTFQKEVQDGNTYCPATHIFSKEEFFSFFEKYYEESLLKKDEAEKGTLSQRRGSDNGKRGYKLERDLVEILNDRSLLEKFRESKTEPSDHFHLIVSQICKNNDIQANNVHAISATDTVPPLKSGGSAKTDIIIKVSSHNEEIISTLSVKRTNGKVVSCHQYSAEDFIRVLGCRDTKLAVYIEKFQAVGSYAKFEKSLSKDESPQDFALKMKPYSRRLAEWALRGMHDSEKLIDPQIQTSDYLFVMKDDMAYCITFNAYIEKLFKIKGIMKFGVPLTWTYASGGLGKNIQLKMPIRFE